MQYFKVKTPPRKPLPPEYRTLRRVQVLHQTNSVHEMSKSWFMPYVYEKCSEGPVSRLHSWTCLSSQRSSNSDELNCVSYSSFVTQHVLQKRRENEMDCLKPPTVLLPTLSLNHSRSVPLNVHLTPPLTTVIPSSAETFKSPTKGFKTLLSPCFSTTGTVAAIT